VKKKTDFAATLATCRQSVILNAFLRAPLPQARQLRHS